MEQIFLFLKKIFFLTQNVSNVLTQHNKLKFQSLFKIRCLFYVIALSNVIYADSGTFWILSQEIICWFIVCFGSSK